MVTPIVIPADLGKRDGHPTMLPGDQAACFLLYREFANVQLIARFTIDGEPQSKARARHTRSGQTYSPAANREAEEIVGWRFRQAARAVRPDAEHSFGVVALFFSATQQRRDVDNMLKLVLDGLNKVAWVDDSQVSEISGRKEIVDDLAHARTEVAVYRLGPVPRRTANCEHCGNEFPVYRSQKGRRFCSRACDLARRAAARMRTCDQCGKQFDGTGAAKYCSLGCFDAARRRTVACSVCGVEFVKQRCHVGEANYCSRECRETKWREHRKRAAQGSCESCGGPTSKKSYKQCRVCRQGKGDVPGQPNLRIRPGGAT